MWNLIISMLGGAGRYAEAMAFSPGGTRRGELTVTWEDKAGLAPRRCCSWESRSHGMHHIRCQPWGTPGGSWPSQAPQWSEHQETTHATEVSPLSTTACLALHFMRLFSRGMDEKTSGWDQWVTLFLFGVAVWLHNSAAMLDNMSVFYWSYILHIVMVIEILVRLFSVLSSEDALIKIFTELQKLSCFWLSYLLKLYCKQRANSISTLNKQLEFRWENVSRFFICLFFKA